MFASLRWDAPELPILLSGAAVAMLAMLVALLWRPAEEEPRGRDGSPRVAVTCESCNKRSMPSSHGQDRELVWISAAAALLTVCAIFVASILHANLLGWIIGRGLFLPVFGGLLLVRAIVGIISFFDRERPAETRTIRAAFFRDKWLHDRLKVSQPRLVVTFGLSLVFLNLAMFGAITLSALCVFFHLMSLGQAVSMFVVGTMVLISLKAIAGGTLLLRQLQTDRRARQT